MMMFRNALLGVAAMVSGGAVEPRSSRMAERLGRASISALLL